MKAVRIHKYGGPEVLVYEDAPRSKPRRDAGLAHMNGLNR
jgi:NADPH:quinone reductase-like Zn-dependent oxidoreductase